MEKGLGTTCFKNGKLQVVKDRQASRKLCFLDLLVNVASSLTKNFPKKYGFVVVPIQFCL